MLLAEQLRDPATVPPQWLPSPDALPSWHSPRELVTNYTTAPPWWHRWMLTMIVGVLGALVTSTVWLPFFETMVEERVVSLIVGIVVLTAVVINLIAELRFHRRKSAEVQRLRALLQNCAVPVWVVRETRVLVPSGFDDVDSLQFVFDLRVPRSVLALQRRVVEAWLDRIVANAQPIEHGFMAAGPLHCVDIFGETMRGVWIWRKRAVVPIQVLGLAVDDPRTTESLWGGDVVFMRDQPRELRHRSRIS